MELSRKQLMRRICRKCAHTIDWHEHYASEGNTWCAHDNCQCKRFKPMRCWTLLFWLVNEAWKRIKR